MELEKIAESLYSQQPEAAAKLDKELDRFAALLEEVGNAVLIRMEKARYRKEKDPEQIKEYSRVYRLIRRELQSIENCRAAFASTKEEILSRKESGERIDYEQYRVDESVSYPLDSVITNKKPAAFSLYGERYEAGSRKQVLLRTCAALNRMDPMLFASLERDPELQGRKRPYFSGSGEGLDAPVKVPDADVFEETHVSARYLKKMIRRLLMKFSIPEEEYRIYLRKDFTVLHGKKKEGPGGENVRVEKDAGAPGSDVPDGQISLFDYDRDL